MGWDSILRRYIKGPFMLTCCHYGGREMGYPCPVPFSFSKGYGVL